MNRIKIKSNTRLKSIGKWDAMPLSVKPDHIDKERDARAHVVSHDQSEEEGAGTAIGSAAAKTQDGELAQPAEERLGKTTWVTGYAGPVARPSGCRGHQV